MQRLSDCCGQLEVCSLLKIAETNGEGGIRTLDEVYTP